MDSISGPMLNGKREPETYPFPLHAAVPGRPVQRRWRALRELYSPGNNLPTRFLFGPQKKKCR